MRPLTRPPFCPERHCRNHRDPPSGWCTRHGTYETKIAGTVTRFRCTACGRTFSIRFFHIDYYAKRRLDYRKLAQLQGSCCGVRQMARYFGCDHKTVENKTMRLCRQILAAHTHIQDHYGISENLVADGLVSYWVNQYVPSEITVLAGSVSRYIISMDGVSVRRRGRMTEGQKKRREELEKLYTADPDAVGRSFREICDIVYDLVDARGDGTTTLDTDMHRAYRKAVRDHLGLEELSKKKRFRHRRTSSKRPRTKENPLAPVNTIDRQIRIDLAEHVRETVRFARNPNRCMERIWVWLYRYNYHKRWFINQPVSKTTTHADAAGIDPRVQREAFQGIYTRRRIFSLEPLRRGELRTWIRIIELPFRHHKPDYLPQYLLA